MTRASDWEESINKEYAEEPCVSQAFVTEQKGPSFWLDAYWWTNLGPVLWTGIRQLTSELASNLGKWRIDWGGQWGQRKEIRHLLGWSSTVLRRSQRNTREIAENSRMWYPWGPSSTPHPAFGEDYRLKGMLCPASWVRTVYAESPMESVLELSSEARMPWGSKQKKMILQPALGHLTSEWTSIVPRALEKVESTSEGL